MTDEEKIRVGDVFLDHKRDRYLRVINFDGPAKDRSAVLVPLGRGRDAVPDHVRLKSQLTTKRKAVIRGIATRTTIKFRDLLNPRFFTRASQGDERK